METHGSCDSNFVCGYTVIIDHSTSKDAKIMKTRTPLRKPSDSHTTYDNPTHLARGGRTRRHILGAAATALLATVTFAVGPIASADQSPGVDNSTNQHWVASWATSPAAYFVYAAPIPQNQALEFATTKSAVASVQPDLAFPFPDSVLSLP